MKQLWWSMIWQYLSKLLRLIPYLRAQLRKTDGRVCSGRCKPCVPIKLFRQHRLHSLKTKHSPECLTFWNWLNKQRHSTLSFMSQTKVSYLACVKKKKLHRILGNMIAIEEKQMFKRQSQWGGSLDKGTCHKSLVTWVWAPGTHLKVEERNDFTKSSFTSTYMSWHPNTTSHITLTHNAYKYISKWQTEAGGSLFCTLAWIFSLYNVYRPSVKIHFKCKT